MPRVAVDAACVADRAKRAHRGCDACKAEDMRGISAVAVLSCAAVLAHVCDCYLKDMLRTHAWMHQPSSDVFTLRCRRSALGSWAYASSSNRRRARGRGRRRPELLPLDIDLGLVIRARGQRAPTPTKSQDFELMSMQLGSNEGQRIPPRSLHPRSLLQHAREAATYVVIDEYPPSDACMSRHR
jgi:hypothetical protein